MGGEFLTTESDSNSNKGGGPREVKKSLSELEEDIESCSEKNQSVKRKK